jgi:hypothetical protein
MRHSTKPICTKPAQLLPIVGALAALACGKAEESAIQEPRPAPSSEKEITSATLGGTLVGSPFTIQSARYTYERRHGFEKVDIHLSQAASDGACGELNPPKASSVWIRRVGPEPLKRETVRLSPKDEGPWQVNYQIHDGHGWRGNGDASALIVIGEIGKDLKLSGILWACFADATGSCVEGRFVAEQCTIRIDAPVRGSETMERLPAHLADGAAPPADGGAEAGESKDSTGHK